MSRSVFWREAGRLLGWRALALGVVVSAGLAMSSHASHRGPSQADPGPPQVHIRLAAGGRIVFGSVSGGPSGGVRGPLPLPVPGEFAPQACLVLSCRFMNLSGGVVPDMVAAAYRNVPILCLVSTPQEQAAAEMLFAQRGVPGGAARFLSVPQDSMWVRDSGPVFVRHTDGSVEAMDAEYAWMHPVADGTGRLETRPNDEVLPEKLAKALNLPVGEVPLSLAGGNLLTNGDGLAVFSNRVLRKNQHRAYDVGKIFQVLHDELGFKQFLCVPPLAGELTEHVDMFLTFAAPNAAVLARCDPAADPANAAMLDAVAAALADIPTSRGPMRVYRVPVPPPRGDRWASFTNVAYANGVLLVPTFSHVGRRIQDQAMALYARLLPGWRIVGIPADNLSEINGLLHCVSMGVPKYVPVGPLAPAGPDRLPEAAGPDPSPGHSRLLPRGRSPAPPSDDPDLATD